MTQEILKILRNLPQIKTSRLTLRKIEMRDAQDLFRCLSDERVTGAMMHRRMTIIDEMNEKIEEYMEEYEMCAGARWCVETELQRVIGSVLLYRVNNATRAVIGFYLNPEFWGCGYASEMVAAVINFGFTRLRLNRIECDCFIENRSSARVMERVGMSFEGESRDYYLVNNVQRSVARYAILKRDWEVMKRDAKTKT